MIFFFCLLQLFCSLPVNEESFPSLVGAAGRISTQEFEHDLCETEMESMVDGGRGELRVIVFVVVVGVRRRAWRRWCFKHIEVTRGLVDRWLTWLIWITHALVHKLGGSVGAVGHKQTIKAMLF